MHEGPIKDSFDFLLSTKRDGKVSEFGVVSGDCTDWNLHLRRLLTDLEMTVLWQGSFLRLRLIPYILIAESGLLRKIRSSDDFFLQVFLMEI